MAKWWESRRNEEDGKEEIVLPKEIQEQLDAAKGLKATVEEQGKKLSKLDEIEAMLREQKEEREALKKPKPKEKTAEEISAEDEELAAMLLTDPRKAHAILNARTDAAVLQVRADSLKREVFEDAEAFPYYTGEVKKEIDKILEGESLQFRNSRQALENTYHLVMGKKMKEITEGKIKDRFASSTSSRTTATGEGDDRRRITVNADIERAAALTGMKVEEYVEMLEKDVDAYV